MAAFRTAGRGTLFALLAAVACRGAVRAELAPAQDAGAAAVDAGVRMHADARPSYDRDADLAQRRAAAREELGDRTVFDVEDGVFLLAAARPSPVFDAGVNLVRQALPAYFHDRFARHPDRAVTVFLFEAAAPYTASCTRHMGMTCPAEFGVYIREKREILANLGPGVTTLSHEIVHPIVQTDFPDAPAWLDEGIGALFEAPVFPSPGEVHGAANWRLARLKAALRSSRESPAVRLDALFATPDDTFRGEAQSLHYAMARYACQWLDERGWLWPFYRAWRDGILDDVHGEKAFRDATGMSPEEANGPWRAWAGKL
jgi:hypothetical protein